MEVAESFRIYFAERVKTNAERHMLCGLIKFSYDSQIIEGPEIWVERQESKQRRRNVKWGPWKDSDGVMWNLFVRLHFDKDSKCKRMVLSRAVPVC